MNTKIISFLCAITMACTLFTVPVAASPNIAAQSAIVIDFETGEILFEKDAHSMRPPASMTKILTAFIVYEEIAAGNLTLDTMVSISPNAAYVSANITIQGNPLALRSGASYSVDTLLHLIMLPSSNGACVALAEHISGSESAFVELMNETGLSIGMYADFRNVHGAVPNYTSAYSVGILVREFIHRHPDILRITSSSSFEFENRTPGNTNLLIQRGSQFYENADGFKTGTTRESGFCLSSTAYRDGTRIIAVIMNAPNNDRRYSDSQSRF